MKSDGDGDKLCSSCGKPFIGYGIACSRECFDDIIEKHNSIIRGLSKCLDEVVRIHTTNQEEDGVTE